jgi:hypothetical protein
MARRTHRHCIAAAALLAALASTQTLAHDATVGDHEGIAPANVVVWVDNESFAFGTCPQATAAASPDPQELMRALRERGLADAGHLLQQRGPLATVLTVTPMSGDAPCDDSVAPSMRFRLSAVDRVTGLAWSSDLLSSLPGKINLAKSSSR